MSIAKVVSFGIAILATAGIVPCEVRAQGPFAPSAGWSLAVAGGAVHAARRDETISPLRFIGSGPAGALDLTRVSEQGRLEFALAGNSANLTSEATASDERVWNGTFSVRALRSSGTLHGVRLSAGIDARVSYDDTFHRFYLSGVASTAYRLAMVTAGPALIVEKGTAWGSFLIRASVPVAGVVDHPYSDVKTSYAPLRASFVSLSRLRQTNADLSYTSANHQRVHVLVLARTNVLSFRDEQSVHAISNSLMLGLTVQHRSPER
jgi:hypothetical protein